MYVRDSTYTDEYGRMFRVRLPNGAPDSDAVYGVRVGPPELELGLPLEVAVRLHNELYHRGMFTWGDVRKRSGDVTAALQAALRVSTQTIIEAYRADAGA